MTLIQIADLTTADIKLSAGADGFLNELTKTETTQIFGGHRGGWYDKGHGKNWKKDDCAWKKEEKCDYSYEEKSDHGSYYKEERSYKHKGGWKKDC